MDEMTKEEAEDAVRSDQKDRRIVSALIGSCRLTWDEMNSVTHLLNCFNDVERRNRQRLRELSA